MNAEVERQRQADDPVHPDEAAVRQQVGDATPQVQGDHRVGVCHETIGPSELIRPVPGPSGRGHWIEAEVEKDQSTVPDVRDHISGIGPGDIHHAAERHPVVVFRQSGGNASDGVDRVT